MRALSAVPIAIAICAAAPAFADVQSHVQAAKKAERRGEWRKALAAWKAAYAADLNAEYLIAIGDSYARLGNTEEAKKNYDAYLADPLALPSNVEKVKTKIAALENPAGGLTLPGAALALPAAAPPPLPVPGLELPGAAPAVAENGRKGKHKKLGDAPLALPVLDLPPAQLAEKKPEPSLPLPGLELPLPGSPPPAAKKEQPAVAINTPPATHISDSLSGKQLAVATPQKERKPVPEAVIAPRPPPAAQSQASGGGSKVLAYVAAGVAVVALGGGAFAFTQAGSAHSELTGSKHDSATAQSLIDKESQNKTLSFVGLTVGLVSAGVATALFAF
jgi:hypothetical protein